MTPPSINVLLMRAIAQELAERIIPELRSADAIERANFARLVLLDLASEASTLGDLAPAHAAGMLDAIEQVPGTLGMRADRAELGSLKKTLPTDPARALPALRELSARILRSLAGRDDDAAHEVGANLGRLDAQWLLDYDAAARAANPPGRTGAESGAAPPPADPDVQTLTAYLSRRCTDTPGIAVTEVVPIPGGRSKKTFFLSVTGSPRFPSNVVMRQDFALKYAGTRVADEYGPLATLAQMGLPVPRPLWLEADSSEAGPPFMLVERLRGKPPGTYFGMATPAPGAFRDLAAMLARLHRIEPARLGFDPGAAPGDRLAALIEQYRSKWSENSTRASPLVDYAYAWAALECRRDAGSACVVHGDAGPYNLLVEDDRLQALLDWEFAHVGDPAEDLGIARIYAEGFMPWGEFMQAYRDAGGVEVAESRIRLGMLLQFLKGTTLVAASGRNFRDGGTRDFIKGANAYTGLRLIELRITGLLRQFEAV